MTVGLAELRRHAAELAEAAGVHVEVEQEGSQVFVIMRSLPLPRGVYRVSATDVLFITDTQYPLSAMDMFWTDITVLRTDGSVPAGGDSIEIYLGRQWRRFSWHRNGIWNPVGNCLLDHFEFMQARFAKDVAA
jgi:hypothetical protein